MGRTRGHAGGDGPGVSAPGGLTRRSAPTSATTAVGCVVLFLFPFAAVGVVTTVFALAAVRDRDWARAGLLAIFALSFGGVGIGGITLALRGRRRVEDALAREARSPESPWLWRADWADRRITDTSRTSMWSAWADRKSTRLNSSHPSISYAVFCLKKKRPHKLDANPQFSKPPIRFLPPALQPNPRIRELSPSLSESRPYPLCCRPVPVLRLPCTLR